MNPQSKNPASRSALRRVLGVALMAAAAAASQSALAQGAGAHGAHGAHGTAHGAAAHGPGPAGGWLQPRRLERLLDGVDATAEQRTQIRQLAQAAQADLAGQREAHRKLREQGLQLWTQPNVDARAAESLRQQMLAQHEQASRRTMQLMLDVGRVLSPEQRKRLVDRLQQRRGMMERHHREREQLERAPG